MDKVYERDFMSELDFTTSKSGGPGGQNVNKVNTKVTLKFDVNQSQLLNDDERQILKERFQNKINNDGCLVIYADSERSQLKNKEAVVDKFYQLLRQAFRVKKKRKPTKVPKSAVEKRLVNKKKHAEKKQNRQKKDF